MNEESDQIVKPAATGKVVKAFGNLLHVAFQGDIHQGEVAMVRLSGGVSLKAEVIEIVGQIAKIQVFEDTRGVRLNTAVEFSSLLLEAELGPGLLTSIFDGLQNPLEQVADATGLFLSRGVYIPPLDFKSHWDFHPIAKEGDVLMAGEILSATQWKDVSTTRSWSLSPFWVNIHIHMGDLTWLLHYRYVVASATR